MKDFYVAYVKTEEQIQDFFMVKTIGIKLGSNKKQYLDILLGDATGEISAKKWDVANEELPSLNEIHEGDFVKVKATVSEWNGMKQLKILKVRKATHTDEMDLADFIKSAPEKSEDMFAFILNKVQSMRDRDFMEISQKLLTQNKEKILYYPAAMKNHHAMLGGLLYHMKRMIMLGEQVCQVYTNLKRDLLLTGVIIHDIEKLNEIEANELGMASGYTFEGQLLGHLIQGVKTIDRLSEELDIPAEKSLMLQHMLISHHYEPEFGSPKKPLFPEAEILHYLDMIDARMYDMEEALRPLQAGEFSEKVWTLDNRKLYKADW